MACIQFRPLCHLVGGSHPTHHASECAPHELPWPCWRPFPGACQAARCCARSRPPAGPAAARHESWMDPDRAHTQHAPCPCHSTPHALCALHYITPATHPAPRLRAAHRKQANSGSIHVTWTANACRVPPCCATRTHKGLLAGTPRCSTACVLPPRPTRPPPRALPWITSSSERTTSSTARNCLHSKHSGPPRPAAPPRHGLHHLCHLLEHLEDLREAGARVR